MKTAFLSIGLALTVLTAKGGSPPVPALRVENEVSVPPLLYDPSGYVHFLIAPDGLQATVTLDASASFNPDNDPLFYFWGYEDIHLNVIRPLPLGDPGQVPGPIFTFPLGIHDPNYNYNFLLQVDDGVNAGTLNFGLYVMPPDEAVEIYILLKLDQLETEQGVRFRNKSALVSLLTDATDDFRAGEAQSAIRLLKRFQHEIHSQERSLGADLAAALIALPQAVIDAVSVRKRQ